MTDNSIYYGSPTIQPSIVPLEAGPLSVIFQDGFLRSISCKNVEIAKRIYFALRDQYWNTIPGKIESLKIDSSVDSFLITFTCNYIHNDINFSCFAEISGSNKGKLEFYIKGVAKSTFLRNRIGFCTLHPVDLCTGKMCTVNHVDGTVYKKAFPVFIEPWQPFKDIRGLEYNINDLSSVKFTFEGDTFECEDQRNWTDNSFKTYSTPLSDPIPQTLLTGMIIEQKVTLEIKNYSSLIGVISFKPALIQIPDLMSLTKSIPEIGTVVDAPISPVVIEKTQSFSPSHLRFDMFPGNKSIIEDMDTAAGICRQTGVPAELSLHFSNDIEYELLLTSQVLSTSQIPVHRFLIFKEGESVTSTETILQTVPILRKYSSNSYIASGTDKYFVEINRNHPAANLVDQICYSANPQVHASDSNALIENLPGIVETLRSAETFLGQAKTIISPVTLRPRLNRNNQKKAGGPDDRQKGLFCSAWTTANLMHCIEGGAASVTYFSLNGNSGIMVDDGSSVYPVYHILLSAAQMYGAKAGGCLCSNPSEFAAVVFVKNIHFLLLVANLTGQPQKITINNLPTMINCKFLDESTYTNLTQFSEQWQCTKGILMSVEGTAHTFDLLPYAVMQIEASLVE